MHWSWFQVTAHTADPNIFYTSEPAKGYSIDNLAPHVPDGLKLSMTTNGILLRWNISNDNDFQYFAIYREFNDLVAPPIEEYTRIASVTGNEYTDNVNIENGYFSYYITAIDFSGNESKPSRKVSTPVLVGVTNGKQLPVIFALHQNYPNPFNPVTNIQYDLPSAAYVTLKVYNMLGEEVTTLVNSDISAGIHNVAWNASELPSGIYQYRITAIPSGDNAKPFIQTYRMVLIK
jgi:hypothetical protein